MIGSGVIGTWKFVESGWGVCVVCVFVADVVDAFCVVDSNVVDCVVTEVVVAAVVDAVEGLDVDFGVVVAVE